MTPETPAPATGRRDTNPVMGDTMGIHPRTISVPPWAVLGYRADGRPIHPIAGGAEDDPEPEADVDVDPEPEPDDQEPEPDGKPKPKPPAKKDDPKPGDDDYEPPSKDEWARTQAALKKANDEAKKHRLRNRELEEQTRTNETDHDKAVREAREEGEKRFREPMKRSGVKAALIEAGFAGPDRLLKLVDWDALSVDDDGDLIGVESEVGRLRAEYPEFLQADKPKPKPKPHGAPRQPGAEKPKSTAEQHAARILGRS
jgi:hypothetical protein